MELLPWLITAFTVVTVFFLDKWENKYLKSLFDWVPAILLAYLIPALISASMGVNFAASSIHAYSKSFFIPLAIVAVMSSLSLIQLRSIGWKPLVIFVSGSFWIALFPVAIGYLFYESQLVQQLFMNQSYWKGLPPIVGSWIGGSTSQLVLKELVNCPEEIFLAILVFDNILVNIWTILMFQGIKRSGKLNSWLAITDLNMPEEISSQKGRLMSPLLLYRCPSPYRFPFPSMDSKLHFEDCTVILHRLNTEQFDKNMEFDLRVEIGKCLDFNCYGHSRLEVELQSISA